MSHYILKNKSNQKFLFDTFASARSVARVITSRKREWYEVWVLLIDPETNISAKDPYLIRIFFSFWEDDGTISCYEIYPEMAEKYRPLFDYGKKKKRPEVQITNKSKFFVAKKVNTKIGWEQIKRTKGCRKALTLTYNQISSNANLKKLVKLLGEGWFSIYVQMGSTTYRFFKVNSGKSWDMYSPKGKKISAKKF